MSSAAKLTLTFLERKPGQAAHVLERLPVKQASVYLETVPARLAGAAVSAMTPWHAARVLEGVAAPRAALLLRQLAFADTTSIVRLVRAELRARILAELPTKYARRLERSLQYPPYQVGAWIDPGVPMLSTADSVDDAIRALRAAEPASHVFLEAQDHGIYAGAVAVQEVLRSELGTPLGQLSGTSVKPVASRASLASVLSDMRWDELLHLPVVDRRGNLLGGISRGALRKGIHDHRLQRISHKRSLMADVGVALLLTGAGMARLLSGAPQARPSESSGGSLNEQ
jgi:Mg/Co/Ni transporter MgtE